MDGAPPEQRRLVGIMVYHNMMHARQLFDCSSALPVYVLDALRIEEQMGERVLAD
jgi:hypothetical protein